ncbi:MAG: hypothetical protein MUF16_26220 [Burkholderiaceae bacterium]|nr:hypothetical protein [Burkholderiaceae bacterium]
MMSSSLAMAQTMREQLIKMYWSDAAQGQRQRFFARIRGRTSKLERLAELKAEAEAHAQHYAGLKAVPIEQITGTEDQAPAFDRNFHPIGDRPRQRWLSVAEARLTGKTLPPVQLVQVGEQYYVRDGHHRISVAQALGEAFIEAEIVRWLMR